MVGPYIVDPRTVADSGRDDATSGRQTLAQIEQAVEELWDKQRTLQGELEQITATRRDFDAQRLTAYRELAEVRTGHVISDGVIDEAGRLAARVASVLAARQKTIDDLKTRVGRADDTCANLIRQRETLADRIEVLEGRLDTLAHAAREALATNRDYRDELAALEAATATCRRAAEKAARSEQDRNNKAKVYENDPLFMYLWRRAYNTDTYNAGNIAAWLDDKIANLIGYHGARANYALLNDIPTRLKLHAEMLANDLMTQQIEVDNRESDKIKEIAGTELPAQLRDARVAEADNRAGIAQAHAELSDLGAQLNRYIEGHDPADRQAVAMAAAFLGQERTTQLMQLARGPTSPSDDQIAARIAKLDAAIANAGRQIGQKTQALEALFEKRDELLQIAADFRCAHYDDSASAFRGKDVGGVLLNDLVRGALSGAVYWARLCGRQAWRTRPADPYRRSERLPPFDGRFTGPSNIWRAAPKRGQGV